MGSKENINDTAVTANAISTDMSNFTGALGEWKKANDAISEAQKAATVVDKAVKAEEAMAQVSTALSQISKISAGFGMAGAAFSLVSAFLPSTDPSDQILNQLAMIEAQISNLQDIVVQKIDTLTTETQAIIQEASLKEHITNLQSLLGNIKSYQNAANRGMDLSPYTDRFNMSQLDDLTKFSESIIQNVIGQDSIGMAQNYLANLYNLSYGEAKQIRNIGFQLINYLISARSAYIFVWSYLLIQDNEKKGKAQIKNSQLESIEANALQNFDNIAIVPLRNAIEVYLKKCKEEEQTNITRYLDDQARTLKRSQTASDSLARDLSQKWPTYSWFVILYEDVKGWNNHGFSSKNSFSYKNWRISGNNIVVNGAKLVNSRSEELVPGPVPSGLPELFLFVQYGRDYNFQTFNQKYGKGKPLLTDWAKLGFIYLFPEKNSPPSAEVLVKTLQGFAQYKLCWYLRRGKNAYYSKNANGLQPPYTRGHGKGFTFLLRT